MFVSVAVPVPFLGQLTYRVPDGVEAPVRGARVLVPLGTRLITGLVIDTTPSGADATKDLVRVLDEKPFLPAEIVDLAVWVADYYGCGPGDAPDAAMPPGA